MVKFLEVNNFLNNGQYCFREGRSCLSRTLVHYEGILQNIKEGDNADVIYLDFAMDKEVYGILLHKLQNFGIARPLGRCQHSFLSWRTQRVSVHWELSAPSQVRSGIPQGSVLGPLLFIVHVSDMDEKLNHSDVTSFADDTRLKKKITHVHDTFHLQEDLNCVLDWAQNLNMALNGEKFELLRYGTNREIIIETDYLCRNHSIPGKKHFKDLGKHMSHDGTFTYHYRGIGKTAMRMSGWVLRTFRTREPEYMLTLWKTMVLPKLEYCCQFWSPHKIQDIVTLEAIQRTVTSRIQGVQLLNYWERLRHLYTTLLSAKKEGSLNNHLRVPDTRRDISECRAPRNAASKKR